MWKPSSVEAFDQWRRCKWVDDHAVAKRNKDCLGQSFCSSVSDLAFGVDVDELGCLGGDELFELVVT